MGHESNQKPDIYIWVHKRKRQFGNIYKVGKTFSILTTDIVREMKELHGTGTYSFKELATMYGITAEHTLAVINGKYWDLPLVK